jgi:hypothetical protein
MAAVIRAPMLPKDLAAMLIEIQRARLLEYSPNASDMGTLCALPIFARMHGAVLKAGRPPCPRGHGGHAVGKEMLSLQCLRLPQI